MDGELKAAFTPGQRVAGNMLLVAVNKIVASLLHRLLLDMLRRLINCRIIIIIKGIHVAKIQATCCRQQATCCRATCCSSAQHVAGQHIALV